MAPVPMFFIGKRVVRDEKELNQIREYIVGNPLKWELDQENPNYNDKQEK